MPESSLWMTCVWLVGVVAASIFYRLRSGKPIKPTIAHDALYSEQKAGGRWASNCLLVSVTQSEVAIVPAFPFNLMFLPEIWGNEYRIPLNDIRSAEVFRGWLMNTKIELTNGKNIPLKLKKPNSFVQALEKANSLPIS